MLGKSRLKYIQSLGHKKHRDLEGLFVAEGPKLAAELLASVPSQIVEVYATADWISGPGAGKGSISITEVSPEELGRMSQLSTPNQVLLVLRKPAMPLQLLTTGRLTLALDTIQDPGNLGTIIRIADWFGITQLVCSPETADVYNPKVVQSTMGSIARVSVLYTELPAWLRENSGAGLYAAALEGTPVKELGRLREGVIIIGNESKGIDLEILALVGNRITIPRMGEAESLNAAVAAGIILSHVV